MFYISLAFSVILVCVTSLIIVCNKRPKYAYLTCLLGLCFGIVPGLCIMPTYLLHAFVLSLFAMLCMLASLRKRTFVVGSLIIFAAVYFSVGWPAWRAIQEVAKLYPEESIDERLAYEADMFKKNGDQEPTILSEQARERSQFDIDRWDGRRIGTLSRLHDNAVQLFVESPGFGVERMRGSSPASVLKAEPIRLAEPLALPQSSPEGYSPPLTAEDTHLSGNPPFAEKAIQSLHTSSLDDFLNPLGFGYVRNRRQVTGFLAHRFTTYPQYAERQGGWRIDALDLISILKHKEPVAYVSKHLPRMDELRAAPTRPLDEFESERLAKLRSGETLSAAEGPRRLRMLGAIRAQEICLNCHTAKKDDLLGAFSYDLRRDWPDDVK
jgi:hypothetical protein